MMIIKKATYDVILTVMAQLLRLLSVNKLFDFSLIFLFLLLVS